MPGSTPIYGFPYPLSTDLVANYPALGQELAEDIEAVLPTIGGLTTSAPTSIANVGGTATATGAQVSFTGVTSVSLNGVFVTGAANYRIILTHTRSASGVTNIRLRTTGTDNANANYDNSYLYGGTASANKSSNAQTSFNQLDSGAANDNGSYTFDVMQPFIAAPTGIVGGREFIFSGAHYCAIYAGRFTASTSFDGFSLISSAGTITGTVRVYQYRNA